ncbi:MAG: hypothetical protein ABJD97_22800, partial [Betaproteobacteria bacterium]
CPSPMPPTTARAPAATPAATAATPAAPAPYLRPARTIDEYRRQAAARMIAANPKTTYTTPSPDPLMAIPILEIEVNGDGSVRHISVVRVPTQAKETVQLAIDAVRRSAPFGDATHLPKPWKFTEVFLFDDDYRFKPRILD